MPNRPVGGLRTERAAKPSVLSEGRSANEAIPTHDAGHRRTTAGLGGTTEYRGVSWIQSCVITSGAGGGNPRHGFEQGVRRQRQRAGPI